MPEHEIVEREILRRPFEYEAAVEEALRFDSPIQGFFRNTLEPVELRGVEIPADEKVMVLYGSANRDERKYPDPDRFIVDRNPADHVAFGAGIHLCLGAPHARLIMRTFLQALIDRVSAIEILGAEEHVEREGAYQRINGYDSLTVRLHAR